MLKTRKILALLRTRGVRGLARALFRRLLFKRWHSIVFVDKTPHEYPPVEWPPGYEYRSYVKACDIAANERDALQHTDASFFLAELSPTDGLYVVWHGMEVASYGAVMSRSPQHSVLGLNEDAPLIGLCETVLSHRKRGLYSRALAQTKRELGLQGKTTVFVEVREDNDASIAGIMKAGFSRWRVVDAQIWFGTLVRRDGHWYRVRRYG